MYENTRRRSVLTIPAIIQSYDNPEEFVGMVSDRRLLSWFDAYSRDTPSFNSFLSNPIHSLALPSLNLNAAVMAAESSATILDAMKLMSEGGVSSIPIVEENHGTLLSAVSVTDIGKVRIAAHSWFQCLKFNCKTVCSAVTKQPGFDNTSSLFCCSNQGIKLVLFSLDKKTKIHLGAGRLHRWCRQIPRFVLVYNLLFSVAHSQYSILGVSIEFIILYYR